MTFLVILSIYLSSQSQFQPPGHDSGQGTMSANEQLPGNPSAQITASKSCPQIARSDSTKELLKWHAYHNLMSTRPTSPSLEKIPLNLD